MQELLELDIYSTFLWRLSVALREHISRKPNTEYLETESRSDSTNIVYHEIYA